MQASILQCRNSSPPPCRADGSLRERVARRSGHPPAVSLRSSRSLMNSALEIPSVRHMVSPEEWQVRVDLAAAYRLVALFGLDDLVFTHISARVPGREHEV